MFSISKMYGMKVVELQELNGLLNTSVTLGQKLLVNKMAAQNVPQQSKVVASIPVKTTPTPKPTVGKFTAEKNVVPNNSANVQNYRTPTDAVNQKNDTVYHVVEQGETFYSISRQYKIKISDIIAWNGIKEYKLNIGAKIVVGAPEPVIPVVTSTPVETQLPSKNNTLFAPNTKNKLDESKFHVVQPKQTLFTLSKMYNVTIDQLKAWNSIKNNSISIGQKLKVKQ